MGAALLAAGLLAAPAAAQEPASPEKEGERLFREHGCYGCHTVGAMGTPIATDLSKVGARNSADYLVKWLKDPKSQKPTAHMPTIQMPEAEAKALAAFLAAQH